MNAALRNDTADKPARGRERRVIDWNAIEADYRSGKLSLRELGAKHGCSHSRIANFATRHGWMRTRETANA